MNRRCAGVGEGVLRLMRLAEIHTRDHAERTLTSEDGGRPG